MALNEEVKGGAKGDPLAGRFLQEEALGFLPRLLKRPVAVAADSQSSIASLDDERLRILADAHAERGRLRVPEIGTRLSLQSSDADVGQQGSGHGAGYFIRMSRGEFR